LKSAGHQQAIEDCRVHQLQEWRSSTLGYTSDAISERANLFPGAFAGHPASRDRPRAANSSQASHDVSARALGEVDQTRNLMFDVIAPNGRYPPNATSLQNSFVAAGEQRYSVHVAIDRFTGQVLDKQIEVVNE
jgi:hypothetical protein